MDPASPKDQKQLGDVGAALTGIPAGVTWLGSKQRAILDHFAILGPQGAFLKLVLSPDYEESPNRSSEWMSSFAPLASRGSSGLLGSRGFDSLQDSQFWFSNTPNLSHRGSCCIQGFRSLLRWSCSC
ncbi:hypothetical protein GX50_05580 [[Emmonsia] crescens]|uniref:Uncharacterized protein n=1 Tax=[Emmonsia] crescens TaxID=73230 RepID=A0A2B7ZEQ6_9EURO|nr:hypothetical protein GX50_05580 [Emmonsia crescens]